MKISRDLISEAWLKLSKESITYVDQWLYDKTVFRIIKACYTSLPDVITFDRKAINHALPSLAGSFDKLNLNHFYDKTSKTKCPCNGKKRSVHYYYSKVHNKPPS